MRRWLRLALLAWIGLAPFAAAAAEEIRLAARETRTLEFVGALAAFAVDVSTVETSSLPGQVVLYGRRAGHTLVTVVLPNGIQTLSVTVDPPPPPTLALDGAARNQKGAWDVRYDTATRRTSSGLVANFGQGERTARLRLEALHQQPRGAEPASTALPLASLEINTPGRSLVLLDKRVEASPLTVDGVMLRGVHLEQGPLELHAGIASATPYDDFLIPGAGDRAFGISWRTRRGGLGLVPALYWLPDSDTPVPGVASLGIESGADGDPLRVRGELAWSGSPGASIDIDLQRPERQAWARAAYRPASFAALRAARPAGSYAEGAWSQQLGANTTAALSVSANRLQLAGSRPEAASARIDLRHQFADHWNLNAGLAAGGFRNSQSQLLRRSAVSLAAGYDADGFGASALYRYQATSAATRGGHGARFSLRGSGSGWRANIFLDAQQQAPTLDLVLQDRPELARAATELGLSAGTPEELIRQLRDNTALLSARGISLGPLRLDPLRLQSGLDLSWRGNGPHAPELGLRLLADDSQGFASGRRNLVATLYANWRVSAATALGASYSRWSMRGAGLDGIPQSSLQLSLRTTFDELALPGEGSRPISGQVLREDVSAGDAAAAPQPLAGVEVVLDRSRRTRTDRDGRFSFDRPGAGAHRVEAVLPDHPGAYFTQPSVRTLQAGSEAGFGVTFSAARLAGRVVSDAGLPLSGVTVRLEGAAQATTTTDSNGAFRFAGPPGEVSVSVVAESLPPGYELGRLGAQHARLAPAAPAVADFTVRAQRAIEGVVGGTDGKRVTVRTLESSRPVVSDAKGRFVLRGLPPGPVTLRVRNERGETRQVVEMPAEPGRVRDVKLAAP